MKRVPAGEQQAVDRGTMFLEEAAEGVEGDAETAAAGFGIDFGPEQLDQDVARVRVVGEVG
jgi:hypothetical protein